MPICKSSTMILYLFFISVMLIGCSPGSAEKQNEILDLMGSKKIDEANEKLQDTLKSYPNDAKLAELKGLLADKFSTRGLDYLNSRNHDKALADFNKSLEIQPDNNDKAYLARGVAHQALGDFEQARSDFKKVIEMNPSDQRTLNAARKSLKSLEGR